MFGKDFVKLKGLRCGVVGKLFRTLKKCKAERKLIVLTIDEFKTSKTCSLCFSDEMCIIDTPSFKGTGVFYCKRCHMIWQRDVNAANNMKTISTSIWSQRGRLAASRRTKNKSP